MPRSKSNLLSRNGKRISYHFIGPIRTWKVKLVTHIPLMYHTYADGQWFTTDYDDAIQYPLVELAGLQRVQYVPEILYEYNRNTGLNDDSTPEKKAHRKETYQWILNLKALNEVNSIEEAIKDKQI